MVKFFLFRHFGLDSKKNSLHTAQSDFPKEMVVKQLGESNFHAFSIKFHRIPIQMQCACSRDSVLFCEHITF